MEREDIVRVRVKGSGGAHFAQGMGQTLTLAAGESSDKWADGSPITRAEFDALLARDGVFEIVEE
jgi:hypothetical protein